MAAQRSTGAAACSGLPPLHTKLSSRRSGAEERPPAALWCLRDRTITPLPRRCAGSLAFLIIQNSSHVLLLRYSRICEGECKEYTVRRSRLRLEPDPDPDPEP